VSSRCCGRWVQLEKIKIKVTTQVQFEI
jgi:hypothetical protein